MDLGAVFFIVFIMSYANQWLPGCVNIYILFFVFFLCCFFSDLDWDTNTHRQIRAFLSGALTSEPEVFTAPEALSSLANIIVTKSLFFFLYQSLQYLTQGLLFFFVAMMSLQCQCSPADSDSAPVIRRRTKAAFSLTFFFFSFQRSFFLVIDSFNI